MRMLVHNVVNTLKSLTWTVILLFVSLYLFAVRFTQATTEYFIADYYIDHPPCQASTATIEATTLHYYFGSTARSTFTLFKTLTGGVSWQDVSEPLEDVSLLWAVFFVRFLSFCYLAVLNIVTGIVCTTAMESANDDLDMQVQASLEER